MGVIQRAIVVTAASGSLAVALTGPAAAAAPQGYCPVPFHATTLEQLLQDSGKDPAALTAFFNAVNVNGDTIICTKGLPVTPANPAGSGIGLDNKAALPADR